MENITKCLWKNAILNAIKNHNVKGSHLKQLKKYAGCAEQGVQVHHFKDIIATIHQATLFLLEVKDALTCPSFQETRSSLTNAKV